MKVRVQPLLGRVLLFEGTVGIRSTSHCPRIQIPLLVVTMKQSLRVNRRRFLATGGLAGAAPLVSAQAPKAKSILITSGGGRLAQALASGLKETYSIRLTERAPIRTEHEFVQCALGHDSATDEVVRGVEAIVHVAEPLPEEPPEQQIDFLTRCTYNLLWSAAEGKVPRIVFLSTLEMMTGYEPSYTVSENWLPLPSMTTIVLAKHLGEYVSREFAREGKIQIVVLRAGQSSTSRRGQGPTTRPSLGGRARRSARGLMRSQRQAEYLAGLPYPIGFAGRAILGQACPDSVGISTAISMVTGRAA